ncbi:serine/threonine-protein kinase [Actinoplanes sp. NBRC 103695]|uniref:serine/threonine-protein kinase n=1 Tax=Actinoplanes sp. NBRC 103695 TaxID=3032202 RepID=UPI0025539B14|nr:serine/threonine-protein kinase [Actinoplanes sp. NBRC 103695]
MTSGLMVPPGTRIGDRYDVLEALGEGTQGQVYRVLDRNLGVEQALKLLRPQPGEPATWDEAKILKRLESDYLLRVLNADVASPADLRYITTPLLPGGDIEAKIRNRGITPSKAIRWGMQVAHGLQRIHDERLLHRDIKPANVYLDSAGDALLGDLGLAIQMGPDGKSPPRGTPQTMAPEALSTFGKCSVRTDIYSLAATVFFMMTGQYPVYNRGDVAKRVLKGERRSVRDLAPHVSRATGTVIERSLSYDPEGRAASARDFANQLSQASPHPREWSLLADHEDHQICLRGEPFRFRRGITVCAIPSGGKWKTEVYRDGGRRARKLEKDGLAYERIAVELRKLAETL